MTPPAVNAAARTCVVCERRLAWPAPPTPRKGGASPAKLYLLCGDFDCRTIFSQAEAVPRGDFRRELKWRADGLRERKMRGARLTAQVEAENREDTIAFAILARRARAGPAPDLHLSIPSGPRGLRRVSSRRRRAYTTHLDRIIAEALDGMEPPGEPAAPDGPAPPASSLPGRLCGACGGGCCVDGADHAYLGAKTIRRILAADPAMDPGRLRAAYLDRLPVQAMAHSCINHTPTGCSLPQDLRSDVCNTYQCAALQCLQEGLSADPPVRAVLVLRRRENLWRQAEPDRNNPIVDAALLTETETRRLRPPRASFDTATASPAQDDD